MTTTLTRPETQQPVVEAAPTANRFPITLLVAVAVFATAILVGQVATSPAVDGSHEVAEFGRQTALATVDNSHNAAEFARQIALATVDNSHAAAEFARQSAIGAVVSIDESHQIAESARMNGLAPVADDSFERNEAERQASLGG
jgi:hypothetical protein